MRNIGGYFFMKITNEKEMLYKSIQEKIQTNHLSIRKACLMHGMNDSSAYRHWVKKQEEAKEGVQVITLKAKPEIVKRKIHTNLGGVSFDLEYSDQDELVSILRAFKNV